MEPIGVGALNLKEAFLFQLNDIDVEESLYPLVETLIVNFEAIESYNKEARFLEALSVIKKFRNPPALDFLEDEKEVIPDIFVYQKEGAIEVQLNDAYYPEIVIDTEGVDETHAFVSQKIKDAKDLVDALEMRKATLYKIGLMIVEYQYDFFMGKSIKPMKLKDLADDLGRNPSTISRAIANKYLSCSRGVIPLKQFFAAALEEEISNSAIKEYMLELVKKEYRLKPMSDLKLLELIEKKFNIQIDALTTLPAEYKYLFGDPTKGVTSKKYVWDETAGAVWGNGGYLGNTSPGWWTNNKASMDSNDPDYGSEGYMVFSLAGMTLKKSNAAGTKTETGTASLDLAAITKDGNGAVWASAKLITKNVTVLKGVAPNGGNAPVYSYDILKLNDSKLVLAWPEPGSGAWGTAWFWMFRVANN